MSEEGGNNEFSKIRATDKASIQSLTAEMPPITPKWLRDKFNPKAPTVNELRPGEKEENKRILEAQKILVGKD